MYFLYFQEFYLCIISICSVFSSFLCFSITSRGRSWGVVQSPCLNGCRDIDDDNYHEDEDEDEVATKIFTVIIMMMLHLLIVMVNAMTMTMNMNKAKTNEVFHLCFFPPLHFVHFIFQTQ